MHGTNMPTRLGAPDEPEPPTLTEAPVAAESEPSATGNRQAAVTQPLAGRARSATSEPPPEATSEAAPSLAGNPLARTAPPLLPRAQGAAPQAPWATYHGADGDPLAVEIRGPADAEPLAVEIPAIADAEPLSAQIVSPVAWRLVAARILTPADAPAPHRPKPESPAVEAPADEVAAVEVAAVEVAVVESAAVETLAATVQAPEPAYKPLADEASSVVIEPAVAADAPPLSPALAGIDATMPLDQSDPPLVEDSPMVAEFAALPSPPRTIEAPPSQPPTTHTEMPAPVVAPRPAAKTRAARRGPHARTARRRHPVRRAMLLVIEALLVLLVCFEGVSLAFDARAQLAQARSLAHDGLSHLTDLQMLLAGPDKLATVMNPTTLTRAQNDLVAADADFVRLREQLASPQGSVALAEHVPLVNEPLSAAADLAGAADDACQGGLLALSGVQLALSVVHGGVFSDSPSAGGAASLSQATVDQLTSLFAGALRYFDAAVATAGKANLASLPTSVLSVHQRQEVTTVLSGWPTWRPLLVQALSLLGGLPALLGVNSPTSYLVELMDRTELRPGGGFIGNYAVMTIAGGKIQPFNISDTYLLDYPYLNRQNWYSPAPPSFFWWQWASYYGLRDSNFSPDFPTTAQLGMQALAREGGPSTQGVIALTPLAIARVLQVVGSIPMPQYGQTVTAQNLEGLIHYYQEAVGHDPLTGLPQSEQISSSRKRFTALLARALLAKLHGLSSTQLVAIGKQLLTSLRLKELQIYVTAPAFEGLLSQHGLAGSVSAGPGDAVTIVDANATANKANQFVSVAYQDSVALDASGTATHHLTITYTFNATDPAQLFGPDHYLTYLRVYTPPGAQLAHQDGLSNVLGRDQINHSDLAWRQMWGGYVLVHDHIAFVLHFTWSVANIATRHGSGAWLYQLVYQHQAGATQLLNLTITVPGQQTPAVRYNGPLDEDRSFSVRY